MPNQSTSTQLTLHSQPTIKSTTTITTTTPSSTTTPPSSTTITTTITKPVLSLSLPQQQLTNQQQQNSLLTSIKSPINSSKKFIPPPLDLTLSLSIPSSTSTSTSNTNFPNNFQRPPTPLTNAFYSPHDSPDLLHLTASPPNSITPTNSLTPTPPSQYLHQNQLLTRTVEDDVTIEDEERQTAEWMGSYSNYTNNTCAIDNPFNNNELVDRLLNPTPLIPDSEENQEEDSDLTTMEKIFLFAKSENSHHRLIVSQRLPELLEDVDITEAVEYVLPLLSGLTQDDQAIREALGPSFCNIMWYYLSRCPLTHTPDSSNHFQPDLSSTFNSSVDSCTTYTSQDWSADKPRRRPHISLSSFTPSLITLLTDTDCSIGLLTRYGFIVFLCRLLNHPLPDWSEDVKLLSGEPFLPLDCNPSNPQDQYEEYILDDSIRNKIAFELVGSIIDELCGHPQISSSSSLTQVDQNDSNESDEWDTVPLNGNESEPSHTTRQINLPNPSLDPLAAHPSSSLLDPSASQYPTEETQPTDSLSHLHRKQVGLILIELIAQARCLDPSFLYRKLLPKLIHGNLVDQNCRALHHQAASTFTTLIITLSSPWTPSSCTLKNSVELSEESENVLVDSYRSFASDLDPEVRKQIVLGLPALLKLSHHRCRTQLSLELMEQFSQDENQEVRIVGCQILGELIHVFHLANLNVPNQLVEYYLSGYENYHQQSTDEELQGGRATNASDIFTGQNMCFNETNSSSPGPLDQFTNLTQDPHLAPQTSSSFGTSGLSIEHAERAMCCSYNFPAVLLSLGVERWKELRNVFLKLAADVTHPPKIRRSLARSMHELIKLIRAPNKQSTDPRLISLATEDWIKVLQSFLFEDQELTITESVLETLDISLGHILMSLSFLHDSQHIVIVIIDIIDKLSEYFTHNHDNQNSFIHERKITWRIREKVVLSLPQIFKNLKLQLQQIYYQNNKNQFVDLEIEKKLLRCFETLLFLGLHDPAAAVREAAIEFFPVFFSSYAYNEGKDGEADIKKNNQIKKEEFQKKLVGKVKLLSFNSNYKVRMVFPKVISNLIKNNSISIDFFEKEILNNSQLIEISKDKVSGVRISLGRLIQELYLSEQFYSSQLSSPKILQKIILILSNDYESIVRSIVEDLIDKIQRRHDTLEEEEEIVGTKTREKEEEERRRKPSHVEEGNSETSLVTNNKEEIKNSQMTKEAKRSIFNNHYSNNDIRSLDSLEDDDSDDLSGSGIKVEDETRLSEDEGVQIGLGGEEVDFFNSCSSEEDDETNDKISSTSIKEDFNHTGEKPDLLSGETSTKHNCTDPPPYLHPLDNNYLFDYSSSSLPFVKLNSPIGSSSCSEEEYDDDQLLVSSLNGSELGHHNRLVHGPTPGPSGFNSTNTAKFNNPFSRSSELPKNSHLNSDPGADFPHLNSDLGRIDFLETRSIEIDPELIQTSNDDHDKTNLIRRPISELVPCNTTPRIRLPSSPSRNPFSMASCWNSNSNLNSFASTSSSFSRSSSSSSFSSRDKNHGLVMPHSSSSSSGHSNARMRTRTEINHGNLNSQHDEQEESDSTARRGRRNSTGNNHDDDERNASHERGYFYMNQSHSLAQPTITSRASCQNFTLHPQPSSSSSSSTSTTTPHHPLVARLIQPSIPSSSSNSNSLPHSKNIYPAGDQIWMRETDGGFVEVGEY